MSLRYAPKPVEAQELVPLVEISQDLSTAQLRQDAARVVLQVWMSQIAIPQSRL